MHDPSPAFIQEFVESLSESYRKSFDADAIAAHAAVAQARGRASVQIGTFFSPVHYGRGLCVVAADRPGLLAAISAALVAHALDVIHGEAHTRITPAGNREAVDLFWVRQSAGEPEATAVSEQTVRRLERTLSEILMGRRSLSDLAARPVRGAAGEARVRFEETARGELMLEVETEDRPGLLFALAGALSDQHVQITSCEVHSEGTHAQDRFALLELDGSAIGPDRRLVIQVAVLAALEPPASS